MSTSSERDVAVKALSRGATLTAFAAFDDGVFVVEPTGERWCPIDHDVECVAAVSPRRVFVGTFDAGVLRSDDAGRTWEHVGPGDRDGSGVRIGPGAMSVTAIAVSPHDPADIWVGTEPSTLYRSDDAGASWTKVPSLDRVPSASSWSFPPRPDTHHVRWVELDPHDPDRVYVGIEAGALLVSDDGGETWVDRPPGSRVDNHSLSTHPDAPGRIYSAAGDGYAESRDSGRSWQHPTNGMDHGYVWSVAVDRGYPNGVVVSAANGPRAAHDIETAESYIYRWAGGQWSVSMAGLPDPDGTLRPLIAPTDEYGGFVLVSNHGVFRSSDGGWTWRSWASRWPDALREKAPRGLSVVG